MTESKGTKLLLIFTTIVVITVDTIHGGNLALQQPVTMSSTLRTDLKTIAENAVDGNPRSDYPYGAVTTFSTNPWWQVDLVKSYVVDDVYIIGRSDVCCVTRLNGAVITVGDNENGILNAECATIQGVTSALKRSFKCNPGLRGRYVTIHQQGQSKIISLFEVMVNENPTANLAFNKATTQSNIYLSGVSSRAVDGNRDGRWDIGSCTHTAVHGETNPWWRVDFGTTQQVSEVFLINRVDHGAPQRLVNIEIRIGDSLTDNGNANPRCGGIHSMATLLKASFYCKPRKAGRYLNIRLASSAMTLTLCEVEVYSESKATLPYKPEDPTAVVPIDVLVQRGSPKLTCPEPFGYPVPYVAWVRDGVVHQNSTTDLVLSSSALTNRRNQSVWECVVTNKHGTDFHQFIVEGSYRICAKYKDLLATDRSIHVTGNSAFSDSSIDENVWFRLVDDQSSVLQIPESCVSPSRCSTQAPGWLLGSHPSKEDGVVERTVCFSWHGNCCQYNTSVFIRRCHGYYVYKFKKTAFGVNARYCAVDSRLRDSSIMFQSMSDHALENHVINTERDLSMHECISVCLSHGSCPSINYDETAQICEMNNATKEESRDSEWRERPGNQYYEEIKVMEMIP